MGKTRIIRYFLIISLFIISIILYFAFLVNLYYIPNGEHYLNATPSFLFIGFSIIIAGIFYLFLVIQRNPVNYNIIKLKMFNENIIKLLLIILMSVAYFFPPVNFSVMIVDWNQIGYLTILRAIIFLIGSSFLPGACIFQILFKNSKIHEKFNVNPILIKMIFYPTISFTFLELISLLLDVIGLERELISTGLFLVIFLLLILDFIIQKFRDKQDFIKGFTILKISKFTLFILIISIGVVLIALDISLSSPYLYPGDGPDAISYAKFIGDSSFRNFYTSGAFWGYITFSLSVLSGLPFINVNYLLFPFQYLFITSCYLFCKSLLFKLKEFYSILATILIVTFSNLFYLFNHSFDQYSVSKFIFDVLFLFRYKSFAFILLVQSLSLFIIISRNSDDFNFKISFKNQNFFILILSVWCFTFSILHYFIPFIIGILFFSLYCLFSKNKRYDIKLYFTFFFLFFILFLLFNEISLKNFSNIAISFFYAFLGEIPPEGYLIRSFILYAIFGLFLILLYFIYKTNLMCNYIHFKKSNNINRLIRVVLKLFLGIFSIFLILDIFFILNLRKELDFLTFYLDLVLLKIGFIGIFGIYSIFSSYNKNKNLLYFLLTWLFFLILISSSLIFIRWAQFTFSNPIDLPNNYYYWMVYWFERTWYYSIFPLSILSAIGLIRIIEKINSSKIDKNSIKKTLALPLSILSAIGLIKIIEKINFRRIKEKSIKSTLNILLISILIFTALSNTIIAGLDFKNKPWYLTHEEAQVVGWVSENIPCNSELLIDSHNFYRNIDTLAFSNTNWINLEVQEAINSLNSSEYGEISYDYDSNSFIDIIEKLGGIEKVIRINDQSNTGSASILANFNPNQVYGSIEFLIRTTNASKPFWINLYSNSIQISIMNNGFFYYNGSLYNKIIDIEDDKWYKIQMDFECTDGNYMELNKFYWKININGTVYGDYPFWKNISQINNLNFYTSESEFGFNVFLSNLAFSWALDYDIIEWIFYKRVAIFNHLKLKNIQYFIHTPFGSGKYSMGMNYYQMIAERSINIERELIQYLYNMSIYEYGGIILYYAPFFD